MDIKDLKNKTVAELKALLKEKREELLKLRFKVSNRQLKNVRAIRETKKDIARILTLINLKDKENKNK